MKKITRTIEGKLPTFSIKRNGQHIGILNTEPENLISDAVYYETTIRPSVGDNIILPPQIRGEIAFKIVEEKDVYFGIIYPNEKKYKKQVWSVELIAQELANFTTVSKVTHWGENIYIHLTRDRESEEFSILMSTAYNWED